VIAALVGLGAFLLFVVQLLLGKRLLPWFGGGSAVWTTCLVFYQLALLVGYGWAHGLAQLAPRRQRDLHIALLAAALALVLWRAFAWPSPITPDGRPSPSRSAGGPKHPVAAGSAIGSLWRSPPRARYSGLVRAAAARRIALPCSLSDARSLAGRRYPLVIERALGVVAQGWLWSATFVAFAVGVGWCALEAGRTAPTDPTSARARHRRARRESVKRQCTLRSPSSRRWRSRR
jgi:hypothetical protein